MITNSYNNPSSRVYPETPRLRTVNNVTSTGSLSDDLSRYHGIPIVPSPVVPFTDLVGRVANADTVADIHAQVNMRMQTLRRQGHTTLGEAKRLFGIPSGSNDTLRIDPQMVTAIVTIEQGNVEIALRYLASATGSDWEITDRMIPNTLREP